MVNLRLMKSNKLILKKRSGKKIVTATNSKGQQMQRILILNDLSGISSAIDFKTLQN